MKDARQMTAKTRNTVWVKYLLIALIVEKSIQHIFVTLAFYFNWGNIGSTVAVSPRILMILGAVSSCHLLYPQYLGSHCSKEVGRESYHRSGYIRIVGELWHREELTS